MNLADVHFIVVEDQDHEREEVLNVLQKAGLEYDNCLAEAATYSAARDLIDQNAKDLDLVFLDLNIPRDHLSGDLDKDYGYQLLQWIQSDLNTRTDIHIRVIIVSGEYSEYGVRDKDFRERYEHTLVDIASKSDLPNALGRCLAALGRDPLLERIKALRVPIVGEYLVVNNPQKPALARLEAAKEIACRLLMREGEFRKGSLGTCSQYADNLNKAIKDLIEQRFEVDAVTHHRHPSIKLLQPGTSWGHFLWRGTMHQHIYAINAYYNYYKHVSQQPYTSPAGTTDEWTIPKPDLDHFNAGHDAVEIVPIVVREVLRWYLPWHEQVYLPWFKTASTSGGKA